MQITHADYIGWLGEGQPMNQDWRTTQAGLMAWQRCPLKRDDPTIHLIICLYDEGQAFFRYIGTDPTKTQGEAEFLRELLATHRHFINPSILDVLECTTYADEQFSNTGSRPIVV